MPELGAIQSSPTLAEAPNAAELAPPKLLVNADAASPQASLNAVTATANEKNMLNNIKGGGGTKRRLRRRRTCTCRRKKCTCISHSRSRRSRSRRKSKGFTAYQRQIVNRRVELNLLHRKIRKNKNNQNRTRSQRLAQYGGEFAQVTTPQHGASCSEGQHNCPGNSSALLLDVQRQSTVNAQGDIPVTTK
jgi:hypothetical protein